MFDFNGKAQVVAEALYQKYLENEKDIEIKTGVYSTLKKHGIGLRYVKNIVVATTDDTNAVDRQMTAKIDVVFQNIPFHKMKSLVERVKECKSYIEKTICPKPVISFSLFEPPVPKYPKCDYGQMLFAFDGEFSKIHTRTLRILKKKREEAKEKEFSVDPTSYSKGDLLPRRIPWGYLHDSGVAPTGFGFLYTSLSKEQLLRAIGSGVASGVFKPLCRTFLRMDTSFVVGVHFGSIAARVDKDDDVLRLQSLPDISIHSTDNPIPPNHAYLIAHNGTVIRRLDKLMVADLRRALQDRNLDPANN